MYSWAEAIKILRSKTVFIHHHDNWQVPFSVEISRSNRKRAQRMEDGIKWSDGNIRVIVSEYFKAITLE